MDLTRQQRKRLAREARKLAMECVEGTAPEFGFSVLFVDRAPHCSFGHLAVRSNIQWPYNPRNDDMHIVAEANDMRLSMAERHAALVFPLLALATALDGKVL